MRVKNELSQKRAELLKDSSEVFLKNAFLTVARGFVGVKENGPNDGEIINLFQKAVDGKAENEPWCFTGDTEILTDVGWVRFDLLKNEMVAQITDNHKIEFVKPIEKIKKQYAGDGYHLKNRSIDLKCDKNHRFYGKFNYENDFSLKPLSEVDSKISIPAVESSAQEYSISDNDLSFLAAYLSDGFLSSTRQKRPRIRIQVSRNRKIEKLDTFGYVGKYTASTVYGLSKTPLTTYSFLVPSIFDKIFESYKEMSWDFVLSLSKRQCQVFIDNYLIFDGSTENKSKMVFSSRKLLADQILTIVSMAGHLPNMTKQCSKISGKPCYKITWCEDKKSRTIRKQSIKKINLSENLYCVSVPSGKIYVRGKNGTPIVVGNCLGFVWFCIKEAETLIEEIFDIELDSHTALFQTEHCLNMWNKSPKQNQIAKPEPGCLIVWQRYVDDKQTAQGHIGIVTKVLDEQTVKTIEGNSSPYGLTREGYGVFEHTRFPAHRINNLRLKGFLKIW